MTDYYVADNVPLPADPAEIIVGGDTIGGTGIYDWGPPHLPPPQPQYYYDMPPPQQPPLKNKKKFRKFEEGGSARWGSGLAIFFAIIFILFVIGWLSSQPSAPENITFR